MLQMRVQGALLEESPDVSSEKAKAERRIPGKGRVRAKA